MRSQTLEGILCFPPHPRAPARVLYPSRKQGLIQRVGRKGHGRPIWIKVPSILVKNLALSGKISCACESVSFRNETFLWFQPFGSIMTMSNFEAFWKRGKVTGNLFQQKDHFLKGISHYWVFCFNSFFRSRRLPSFVRSSLSQSRVGKYITGHSSVMLAPIELKFAGDILGIIDFPAVGLMKKCMIPFKWNTHVPLRRANFTYKCPNGGQILRASQLRLQNGTSLTQTPIYRQIFTVACMTFDLSSDKPIYLNS